MSFERRNIWILCPVYKDVEAFVAVKNQIENFNSETNPFSQWINFIVVDDSGGLDPEIEKLSSDPRVEVLTCPYNMGHQRAIVFGLRKSMQKMADGDICVTMDSDGQDKPEDISRLIEPLLKDTTGFDRISLAYRTKRKESFLFKALYFFYKIGFRILTGKSVRSGNFAAYSARLLKQMIHNPIFDLCYSSSLISTNLPLELVGCERGERIAGKSRMNLLKLFIHGFRMLMPFIDSIAIRFLFFFSTLFSVSLILFGLFVGGYTFNLPVWFGYILVAIAALSMATIMNLIILFTLYVQSQAMSVSKNRP